MVDDPRPSSWRDRAGGLARGLRDEAVRVREGVAERSRGAGGDPSGPPADPPAERPGGRPAVDHAAAHGPWAPLGAAGETTVVDTLTSAQFHTFPVRTPDQHRADLDVAGHRLDLRWVAPRTLVATSADGVELARGRRGPTDVGTFVWPYHAMPLEVLGEQVAVERRPRGAGWELAVSAAGRGWSWRAGSGLWAAGMELVRAGERRAVVTHQLPPSFAATLPPLRVSWTAEASLLEVVMPVMWVLDRAYEGLLPKLQGAARGEML